MLQTIALLVSFLVSAVWLAGAGAYVDGHIGWENLLHQHPSELAALMAGIFTPLALLWLLVAYFRQASAQHQLSYALKQLHWQARKSAEQTETIVRALAETQTHERQAQALAVFERGLSDLQALGARLTVGFGRIAPRDLPGLWRMTQSGDRFAIFRSLLGEDPGSEETRIILAARLQQAPGLRAIVSEFVQLQENLSDFATKHGIDPLLRDGFEHGPPARSVVLLRAVLRTEPAPPPPVFQHEPEFEPPAQAFEAETAPTPAMLAHRVAKVLWPQGAAAPPPPKPSAPDAEFAPPPPPILKPAPIPLADPGPPPSEPAPAAASSSGSRGNVMPFSPLTPGFPRNPGP